MVYVINTIDKGIIILSMTTFQLLDEKGYYKQIVMYTENSTYGVSFSREFQKHISNVAHKHGVNCQDFF